MALGQRRMLPLVYCKQVTKWGQRFILENEESLPSITAGLDPLCSGMHVPSSWNNC